MISTRNSNVGQHNAYCQNFSKGLRINKVQKVKLGALVTRSCSTKKKTGTAGYKLGIEEDVEGKETILKNWENANDGS